MITRLIKIGNSKGIRIPKILLEESGLTDEVELEVKKNLLIIRSTKNVRQGWEEAFKAMAENKDDQLIDGDATIAQSDWDSNEWEW